ncbi:hypothetical protein BDU57DRAFT_518744 [Ampelomyces quisqualis]|uniref:Uncharacterized protein n=1 Tax=Ampelomyces quisqualis TaxID=50730 RepID=A0A6A5QJT2_AMPQU|nr:hypothetical protein BDU57DRAFT_518744 [Ampelomyces quisqualis]
MFEADRLASKEPSHSQVEKILTLSIYTPVFSQCRLSTWPGCIWQLSWFGLGYMRFLLQVRDFSICPRPRAAM